MQYTNAIWMVTCTGITKGYIATHTNQFSGLNGLHTSEPK